MFFFCIRHFQLCQRYGPRRASRVRRIRTSAESIIFGTCRDDFNPVSTVSTCKQCGTHGNCHLCSICQKTHIVEERQLELPLGRRWLRRGLGSCGRHRHVTGSPRSAPSTSEPSQPAVQLSVIRLSLVTPLFCSVTGSMEELMPDIHGCSVALDSWKRTHQLADLQEWWPRHHMKPARGVCFPTRRVG